MPNRKRKPLIEKPNKGGRPPISEVTKMSDDMKEVAMLTANGYDAGEIAEKLDTSGKRVLEILKNPLVLKRIQKERGDFVGEWSNMREEILSETYRSWLIILRANKAKPADLKWLLERLEEQEGIYVAPPIDPKGKPGSSSKPNIKRDNQEEKDKMDEIMDGLTE